MTKHTDITFSNPKKRRGLLWGCVLIILALVGAACGSDELAQDPPTLTETTESPIQTTEAPAQTTEAQPPSTSESCVDGLPDVAMQCGHLTVPVDYDEPGGSTYSLPYVVLPALGGTPSDEPVAFLQGGPGYSTMSIVSFFVDNLELRQDRDMIFLEQRGTDPSGLFLDCDSPFDIQACYDGYVSDGIDLSSFTTLNSAKDLATLRSELGIERWHLLGGSYGTTLAMVAMDNDPEGTASVILDAPTAPDVIIYNADTESLLNAFSKVFDNCAADADCAERHPDLFNRHLANFDTLATEPWNLTNPDLVAQAGPVLGPDFYFEVGVEVVQGSPGVLPALVTAVADRDEDALLELFNGDPAEDPDEPDDGPESGQSGFARGLNHSIYCAEEAPFFDLTTNPIDTVDDWPADAFDLLLGINVIDCDTWQVDAADLGDVDRITSAIPTLILAGEYDHTTPLRQAEIAAAGLSNAEVIEVPSTGHTTLDNECARHIMVDFLQAPGGDRTCLATIEPIEWR